MALYFTPANIQTNYIAPKNHIHCDFIFLDRVDCLKVGFIALHLEELFQIPVFRLINLNVHSPSGQKLAWAQIYRNYLCVHCKWKLEAGIKSAIVYKTANRKKHYSLNLFSQVGLSGDTIEDGETLENTKAAPCYSHEWLFLAKAGDRVCVIILAAVYIFSLIGYVSPINWDNLLLSVKFKIQKKSIVYVYQSETRIYILGIS